jgi:hypothetical protein
MLADPLFRVLNLAYAAAFSGLAIAACAAYDKQARAAGTFGLVAFGAAIVGTVNLGANMQNPCPQTCEAEGDTGHQMA